MPQIGWLEILAVVIIAILVLGPKEFPIALKKIGFYVGKIKNLFININKHNSYLSVGSLYSISRNLNISCSVIKLGFPIFFCISSDSIIFFVFL